jgi:MFS family permease
MLDPSQARARVVGLLVLLFGITYLDRVCISVAGPRMQQDLHIDPIGWGWVTGAFTMSYCLFEIPSGILGDRIGPRRVLTRIVLWWSAFTVLTGAAMSYVPLLAARFLFGAGEAGAYPNSSIVISRWFPPTRRASMCGVTLMASQIGAALAPLLVVPMQRLYGWRSSFFVFGILGVGWSIAWYGWFRDSPARVPGAIGPDNAAAAEPMPAMREAFPWRSALRSQSAIALMAAAFCYVYVFNFFQTWFQTFLVKGRGFTETGLLLSTLPYVIAIFATLSGGAVSDALVRGLGHKHGRRVLGAGALCVAGAFVIAAMLARQQMLTVVFLSVVYGAITFQQAGVFGVCLDIGQKHAGAMVGLMNTVAQVGGLVGTVAYGYLVEHFGNYDAPFIPMAALLFLGAALWLRVDASQVLTAAPAREAVLLGA